MVPYNDSYNKSLISWPLTGTINSSSILSVIIRFLGVKHGSLWREQKIKKAANILKKCAIF